MRLFPDGAILFEANEAPLIERYLLAHDLDVADTAGLDEATSGGLLDMAVDLRAFRESQAASAH